ncbi:hypothetical protein ACH3XW_23660 [Acanthocheilonema viteae]
MFLFTSDDLLITINRVEWDVDSTSFGETRLPLDSTSFDETIFSERPLVVLPSTHNICLADGDGCRALFSLSDSTLSLNYLIGWAFAILYVDPFSPLTISWFIYIDIF